MNYICNCWEISMLSISHSKVDFRTLVSFAYASVSRSFLPMEPHVVVSAPWIKKKWRLFSMQGRINLDMGLTQLIIRSMVTCLTNEPAQRCTLFWMMYSFSDRLLFIQHVFLDLLISRFITIMVYLNDVEEGGETAFPAAHNKTYDDEVRKKVCSLLWLFVGHP